MITVFANPGSQNAVLAPSNKAKAFNITTNIMRLFVSSRAKNKTKCYSLRGLAGNVFLSSKNHTKF